MKNSFCKKALCALVLVFVLCLLPQKALAASASLSGNSTVKAGDTITLTLSVSNKICGLSATLNAGSGLTMTSYACADSSLQLTANGNSFAAYGTTLTTGRIITVTLKADSSLSAGAALSASFKDITVTDGDVETNLGSASWSGTVADKPSSVCHLTAIRCSNATLSPAFNKDTTYYTANVPFSVSKLSLDYDRADKTSSVSISGTDLAVGANTITIKVTAADGTTKTYTISVTRQQDPNYKPSTNATLKELKLDIGTISPAFDSKRTEYVAYVPFEAKEATLSGVPSDSKAVTSGEKTVKLTQEGANDVSVVCTAEDGKTIQTYTVHVFRMPLYEDILPTVQVLEAEEVMLPEENVEDTASPINIPAVIELPLIGEASTVLVAGITAVVVFALLFLLGLLIGRRRRDEEEYVDENDYTEDASQLPVLEKLRREVKTETENSAEDAKPEEDVIKEESENREEPVTEDHLQKNVPHSADELEDEVRTAEKAAESMSLDDLLNDIRDM